MNLKNKLSEKHYKNIILQSQRLQKLENTRIVLVLATYNPHIYTHIYSGIMYNSVVCHYSQTCHMSMSYFSSQDSTDFE